MKRPEVFVVGPLPPPVHGFSAITAEMVLALQARFPVKVFDVGSRKGKFHLAVLWLRFIVSVVGAKPAAIYLAFSGGKRQFVDLCFGVVARIFGVPLHIHHHSFSYINKRRGYTGIALRLLPSASHIMLCKCMAHSFAARYGVPKENLRVVSNASFLEGPAAGTVPDASPVLRVGFLSNITEEKGIFEFLNAIENGVSRHCLEAVIAGPLDDAIAAAVLKRVSEAENCRYVGAVYGADKHDFFSNIDVLVFPTKYPNEAEPVTILEALAYGCPVVAFDRGCIKELIPASAGFVVDFGPQVEQEVAHLLRRLSKDRALLQRLAVGAREHFEGLRTSGQHELELWLTEISPGTSK